MRKFLQPLTVLVYLCASLTATAQTRGFGELQSATPKAFKSLTVDSYLTHKLDSHWSVSSFFLTTAGWAEAYAGPEWSPTDWMTLGLSVGMEQGVEGFDLRTAYSLWLGHDKVSFLGIVEAGKVAYSGDDSALWYDLALKYKVLPYLTIGLKDRRPSGVGPLAEVTVGKATLWASWAPLASEKAKFDPKNSLFGVKFSF